VAGVSEPILAAKAAAEVACIDEVMSVSDRTVILPWSSKSADMPTRSECQAPSGGKR
jgi:hypothetical protein